jgi:hypothetical protein
MSHFQVRFFSVEGGVAGQHGHTPGVRDLDAIRSIHGQDCEVEFTPAAYCRVIVIELPETDARRLFDHYGRFSDSGTEEIEVPERALDGYLVLEVDEEHPRMDWVIDTEKLLDDWEEAGCPGSWCFPNEP